MAAAFIWDPETQWRPHEPIKVAYDFRRPERPSWTQPICRWDYLRRFKSEPAQTITHPEHELCCDCGAQTEDGIYARIDPNDVRYPTPKED